MISFLCTIHPTYPQLLLRFSILVTCNLTVIDCVFHLIILSWDTLSFRNLRKYVAHYFQNVSDFISGSYFFLTLSILSFWNLDQTYVRLPFIFPSLLAVVSFSDYSLSIAFMVAFKKYLYFLFSLRVHGFSNLNGNISYFYSFSLSTVISHLL